MRALVPAAVLAVALTFTPNVDATAIVAFRDVGRIILSADSRFTSRKPNTMKAVSSVGCKVHAAGRYWFMLGGYEGGGAADKGMDFPAEIVRAITPADSLPAAMSAIDRLWRSKVRANVLSFVGHPSLQQMFVDGGQVFMLIVAGVDHRVPTIGMFTVALKARAPVELTERRATCPGSLCGADGLVMVGASKAGAMHPFLKRPPAWLRPGTSAAARRLIELEITAAPLSVAAPIDVLEIDATGARWYRRDPQSACPAL
jgi:hypothetical protein